MEEVGFAELRFAPVPTFAGMMTGGGLQILYFFCS
jgi:hypothetical protein